MVSGKEIHKKWEDRGQYRQCKTVSCIEKSVARIYEGEMRLRFLFLLFSKI